MLSPIRTQLGLAFLLPANLLERALASVLDSNWLLGFCREVLVGTSAVERLLDFTP